MLPKSLCCTVSRSPLTVLLFPGEVGGTIGVRNCLSSRQQCTEDSACRNILDIIPRVCGPESGEFDCSHLNLFHEQGK